MEILEQAIDNNLYSELVDQGQHPPGEDPSLGAFYQAVVGMIQTGHPIVSLIAEAREQRPTVTNKHFANLLFRGVQFIELNRGTGDLGYRFYRKPQQWRDELARIIYDDPSRAVLADTLRTKSTTTTIYQRYAGPYATIAHLFNGMPVLIADLGCGGNYGLRGIDLHEPFGPVIDSTPNQLVSYLLSQRINLGKGLAIDKEDPDDPNVRKWRLACNLYPQELDQLPSIEAFENRMRGSERVQFLKANLLTLDFDWLPHNAVDLVIISTMLYQLSQPEQQLVIGKVKHLLKPEGALVVQDFARKDSGNHSSLDFSNSWFDNKFSYRTFLATSKNNWQFQEALQWNNGRCSSVRPGEDFTEIFRKSSRFQPRASRAALAHSTS